MVLFQVLISTCIPLVQVLIPTVTPTLSVCLLVHFKHVCSTDWNIAPWSGFIMLTRSIDTPLTTIVGATWVMNTSCNCRRDGREEVVLKIARSIMVTVLGGLLGDNTDSHWNNRDDSNIVQYPASHRHLLLTSRNQYLNNRTKTCTDSKPFVWIILLIVERPSEVFQIYPVSLSCILFRLSPSPLLSHLPFSLPPSSCNCLPHPHVFVSYTYILRYTYFRVCTYLTVRNRWIFHFER